LKRGSCCADTIFLGVSEAHTHSSVPPTDRHADLEAQPLGRALVHLADAQRFGLQHVSAAAIALEHRAVELEAEVCARVSAGRINCDGGTHPSSAS
jgi:hypothetical protein